MNIEDLQAKLDAARRTHDKRQMVDLPAARDRVTRAQAELHRLTQGEAGGGDPSGSGLFGSSPEMDARREANDSATAEAKAARGALQSLEAEEVALRREIDYLARLLDADQRVLAAEKAVAAAAGPVTKARQHEQAAVQTLVRVDALIELEQRDSASARSRAAEDLLAAVKAGQGTAAVPDVVRDKFDTLTLARAAAVQELEDARTRLRSALQSHTDAMSQLSQARSDVTELAYRLARDNFVEALTAHMAAHVRAFRTGFSDTDPRSEAIEASRLILAAEGM